MRKQGLLRTAPQSRLGDHSQGSEAAGANPLGNFTRVTDSVSYLTLWEAFLMRLGSEELNR